MKFLKGLFFTGVLFILSAASYAGAVPSAPKIAASSYVLMDFDSGDILSEHDVNKAVEPASLTKMMTTYVVFHELDKGNIHLTDLVTVSEKAWKMEGSRMFIEVNKKVSVDDLIKGMVIQSGNDASVALAEHTAGSESAFVDLMNQHAQRLGLTHSHFMNATGLPAEGHIVTAHDMAILARALIKDFPEHYPTHSIKSFTFNDIKQHNRNRLLWRDESVDGIKTGHTKAAGYCLVASAKRNNMRLIAVVMGTDSDKARSQESQKILNYGFRFFETHELYKAMQPVYQVKVYKGEHEKVDVGLREDLWLTVPKGKYKSLNASLKVDKQILAPLAANAPLGEVSISLDGEVLVQKPLYTIHAVAEGSLWKRMQDSVRLMIKGDEE